MGIELLDSTRIERVNIMRDVGWGVGTNDLGVIDALLIERLK